ncbi:DoxX-like family protein [Paenibacillus marinisediminis]
MAKPIYVETNLHTDMDTLWTYTQTPDIHQQWDLRFTTIEYLPKQAEEDPQRFLYTTNIGFGLSIAGEGESVGTSERGGTKTSVLKFWSDNPISLIKEGAGYWKYVPCDECGGIRFFTRYDYDTRFGLLGRLLDRCLFRPIMGYATAWSFDALRLWLEKGIHPKQSLRQSITELLCWCVLSFIWIYQGLFPKLIYPDAGELAILQGTGLFPGFEPIVLGIVGAAEIVFGLLFICSRPTWRRWLYGLNILLLIGLFVGTISQPQLYVEPFNPITLNIGMIALSAIGLLSLPDLASAGVCLRKPIRHRGKEQVL